MKKLLFATVFASTALASSMGCNTDTLTGLHFGLGVSVLFDKYEADVDVATVVSNAGLADDALTTANQKLYKVIQFKSAAAVTKAQMLGSGATAISATNWSISDANTSTAGNAAEAIDGVLPDLTLGGQTIYEDNSTTTNLYLYSPTAYVKRNTFKKRTTNCGGEVKLAYFHDFGNHLMVGVDLTGIIASKNKKTVTVNAQQIVGTTDNTYKEADLRLNGTVIASGSSVTDAGKTLASALATDGTNLLTNATTVDVTNMPALKAANPGFHTIIPVVGETNPDTSLNTIAGSAGELTFEKSVFNPRLAFIVGGTIYGWFAGLRMGMSYTTGKVYAKGLQQDMKSKTVSISSPLIGLHLMKQMKIAGNNDAHLYLTADWNIGDGHRKVDINGVKSFKQTSYNISAGLTWRFKLGN